MRTKQLVRNQSPGLPYPRLPDETLFAASIVNKGMISNIDPGDIPDGALSVGKNVRVRYDKTSRRVGSSLFGSTNMDVVVKKLIEYEEAKDSIYVIAITSVIKAAGSDAYAYYSNAKASVSWIAIDGEPVRGNNPISASVVVGGVLVLANGVNRLQRIDLTAGTIADLSVSAPAARYVTGFAERVVAASTGVSPEGMSTLYWSGNRNITEFDAAIDESSGNKPIDISASASVDPITGVFGLTNVMIIPRTRSLWLCTKTGIATDPLNPYSAVPGYGADIPTSIALTEDGIIFVSKLNGSVYRYRPGGTPTIEDIGMVVANDLLDDIVDPDICFSTYSKYHGEYLFGVPASDYSSTKIWIYNTRTQAWCYDEIAGVSCVLDFSNPTRYTSIDELTGTIDELTGTIDSLSNSPVNDPILLLGKSNGDVLKENASVTADSGISYTTEIRSKQFRIPRDDITVSRIRVGYNCTTAGTLTLAYSKNGTTWITAKVVDTVVGSDQLIKFTKALTTRRFQWRVTATNGLFEITEFEIYVYPDGESKD